MIYSYSKIKLHFLSTSVTEKKFLKCSFVSATTMMNITICLTKTTNGSDCLEYFQQLQCSYVYNEVAAEQLKSVLFIGLKMGISPTQPDGISTH